MQECVITALPLASIGDRECCMLPPNPGNGAMPEYRAYKVGSDGHFFEAVPLVCVNDAEAVGKAKRLVIGNDVELWEGGRKVAALESECKKSGGLITYEIHDGRMISKPAG
jgi:hypothetical protein